MFDKFMTFLQGRFELEKNVEFKNEIKKEFLKFRNIRIRD